MALKDIMDSYTQNAELAKTFITDLQKSGITEETLTNAVRNAADKFKPSENEIIEGQRKRIAEQQAQLQEMQGRIQEMNKKVRGFEDWKHEYMARNVKAVKGSGKIVADSKKKISGKNGKGE